MNNKEIIKGNFGCGATPNADDFAELIDSCIGVLTDPLQLPTAGMLVLGTSYKIGNNLYTCVFNDPDYEWEVLSIGGGGGATSYLTLSDKPSINGNVLGGNKTLSQLGGIDANGNPSATPNDADTFYLNQGGSVKQIPYSNIKRVNADWAQGDSTKPDFIKNKPNLTGVVVDSSYVHTDNNFTNEDRDKLNELYKYSEVEEIHSLLEIDASTSYIVLNTESGYKKISVQDFIASLQG